jgi:hypothetical protein
MYIRSSFTSYSLKTLLTSKSTLGIFDSGLEISAGHWSLTGKISQFDRQILSPGGHAWPVNVLIKKYVQIFYFQCPSTVQANKGGEASDTFCHADTIYRKHALCLRPVFQLRVKNVRRKSLHLLKFHISANNLNKYTLNHTQNWMLFFYKFSYFISRM